MVSVAKDIQIGFHNYQEVYLQVNHYQKILSHH